MRRPAPIADRFWAKVERGDPAACWLWTASLNATGYGQIGSGRGAHATRERVRPLLAHRVSWELHHGEPPPDNLCVCHRCDNPRCVNPGHLFLGTMGDNMRDKVAKGRARSGALRGEDHGNAVLTQAQADSIRARIAAGEKKIDLRREFGVSRNTIRRVAGGKTYQVTEC